MIADAFLKSETWAYSIPAITRSITAYRFAKKLWKTNLNAYLRFLMLSKRKLIKTIMCIIYYLFVLLVILTYYSYKYNIHPLMHLFSFYYDNWM